MKTHWETDIRAQPLVASLEETRALGQMAWILLSMAHGKMCSLFYSSRCF